MKKLLIVGIDPGTTTGYALLDIQGEEVFVNSSREISFDGLVQEISKKGIVLAVGTDKGKCPDLVERFSVKTGGKLFVPSSDLLVTEKKDLAKGHATKNDHELDALASAFFAFHQISLLIKKVEKNTSQVEDTLLLVVRENLPIKDALSLLTMKDEETKTVRRVIREKTYSKKDFLSLYQSYRRLKDENALLQKYVREIRTEAKKQERKASALAKRRSKNASADAKKIDALFSVKEKRIKELDAQISSLYEQQKELESEFSRVDAFIAKIPSHTLLKHLRNLSKQEIEKKNDLVKKGDILLIDDPNVFSDAGLLLVEKARAIVFRTTPSSHTKSRIFVRMIPGGDLIVDEYSDFALADTKKLDAALTKTDVLKRIVEEYKEKRST
jgi:hypothetical protein